MKLRNTLLLCATVLLSFAAYSFKKAPPKYDYYVPIPAIEQPEDMDCWATALTILYSWKNNLSIKIGDVVKLYGEPYIKLFNENLGVTSEEEENLYKKAKLTMIKQSNPSIQGWYDILKKHGPLSITVDAKPPKGMIHALVVNGIKGDGSPNGTNITFVDPAKGKEETLPFSSFIKLYEGSASWPLQIVHYP